MDYKNEIKFKKLEILLFLGLYKVKKNTICLWLKL